MDEKPKLNADKEVIVVDDRHQGLAALMAMTYGAKEFSDVVIHDGRPKIKTYNSKLVERFSDDEWKQRVAKNGKNRKCHCGSGKRTKNCHGR